jgi:hypothetical protein
VPASAIAGADGRAEVVATAGAVAGGFVVAASVNGVAVDGTFALQNLAGPPASVTAVAGTTQTVPVDSEFPELLEVLVLDADENPVTGAGVTFAAPVEGATAVLAASTVATDEYGIATVAVRAGTITGDYQIIATLADGAAPAVFDVANSAGEPASVSASGFSTPQQAVVMTRFTQLLVAVVRDRFDNPVPGVTVTYGMPAAGATGVPRVESAITDGDGRTAIVFTAGAIAGAYQVTATADHVEAPAVYALTNRHGAPHRVETVDGSEQHVVVGGAFAAPLVARVADEQGNPIEGVEVRFAAPADGASAAVAEAIVTTGADGIATTAVDANTVSGGYDVVATTDGGAAPAGFHLRNVSDVAAAIGAVASATPQTAQVGHVFAERLAVTVSDRFGNPVSGARVRFDAPTLGGNPTGGASAQLELAEALSSDAGVAAVHAIAGEIAGSYTIGAHIDGIEERVVFHLTQTAGAPQVVVVTGGAGQRALATTGFAAPLVFRVLDRHGNPIAGMPLTITTPGSGPTVTMVPGVRVTEEDGSVPVVFRAGAVVGDVDVVVTVEGAQAPAIARLAVDPIPTTISATAEAAQASDDAVVSVVVASPVGVPAGEVEVVAGGVVVGRATLDGGRAEVPVTLTGAGDHVLVARFAAQGAFGAATSAAITVEALDGGDGPSGGCNAGGEQAAGLLAVVLAVFALLPMPRRGRARARRR